MTRNETKTVTENTSNKPSVKFENCATVGDTIHALVEHFGGTILGEFTLSTAHRQVQELDILVQKAKADFLESRKVSAKVGGAQ